MSQQILTYTVTIEVVADEGECVEQAEESDVADAIAGAVSELAEYENAASVSASIVTSKENWKVMNDWMRNARIALENKPVEPQDSPSRSEWISGEERLPERGQTVLVFFERELGPYMDVWTYNGNRHFSSKPSKQPHRDVTHWQPLPAPPSPAREPEIVVPALPNKPIDYPVKYRNDEPAREPEIHQPTYEAPEIFRQRLRDSEKEKAE